MTTMTKERTNHPTMRKTESGLFTSAPAPDVEEGVTIRTPGNFPLRPGDEVTIKRLGRCRYQGHVNADGSIDVFYKGRYRSVSIDRVDTVHRKAKIK